METTLEATSNFQARKEQRSLLLVKQTYQERYPPLQLGISLWNSVDISGTH